ncbi:formate-dependent phosphoribosylglycinamide formyltransferase [Alphaproteobacteria bacterium]|nr:formate-dependent phosphoribosylglycinamide formyltransferase [Alphaproteobacteria bacterium]
MKKIMLLGSGELGRELTISLKRLGCTVIACDRYENAPAMQVADRSMVFDMLNEAQLRAHIKSVDPDLVVPEIEAINTQVLLDVESQRTIVPSARAVDLTMNRDRIRDRAAEIGLPTAKYGYAENLEEMLALYNDMACKVVVKPVMSSSGKGQSTVTAGDGAAAQEAWHHAVENMRGDRPKVIVEEFISFDYEITLLTVRQKNAETVYCPVLRHQQVDGDFKMSEQGTFEMGALEGTAQDMAKKMTDDLGGFGLFGVEFFIRGDEVIFSELSPRPHDTGLLTLYTQNLSEFDLHARAILHLPISNIAALRPGACHTINAAQASPDYGVEGLAEVEAMHDVEAMMFGKPDAYPNRRLGIVFAPDVETATAARAKIKLTYASQ